jgi:glycosyltransferase involved in cell wall biosynthesis
MPQPDQQMTASNPNEEASVMRTALVAYVLTRDEEKHVEAVVASLRQVTRVVVVVDSGSTDQTCALALASGAEVWHHEFTDFASQRNWALERLISAYHPAWVVSLDADERLSPGLTGEITGVAAASLGGVDVWLVPRQVRFCGRLLRHGGISRTRLPRLFRPDAGRYEQRPVNEHLEIRPDARVGQLRHPIVHEDVSSWDRYIAKHNRYSSLEAEARLLAVTNRTNAVKLGVALRQRNLRRRWLREQLWNRLPGKPALRFVQLYVLSAGFLDGAPGFRLALFQAWQEMCTDLKYEQLRGASTQGS